MLRSGIPKLDDYQECVSGPDFRRMEEFSEDFLKRNQAALQPYSKKWVGDPLHSWSRQWEYPFVFEHLQDDDPNRAGAEARVLDAGSGFTFFPFYVATQTGFHISCVDTDGSLSEIFQSADAPGKSKVEFTSADISDLPFEDSSFQAIYCISVLEHTRDFLEIIQEFRRVLTADGYLIVTFDVSIDGDRDIPPSRADSLLRELESVFPHSDLEENSFENAVRQPGILTTSKMAQLDRTLLPWRHPLVSTLSSLRKGRLPRRWWSFPDLTCYCAVFR